CCTVRGDLIRIIDGLLKRKGRFDAIIVETTGLADPAPVAQTFFVDAEISGRTKLDAIVTVADAKWLLQRLKAAPEAKNQIAFGDVIVLNKTDLVAPGELAEVEARIRAINPYAALYKTQGCALPVAGLLNRGAFDLERILDLEPHFLEADDDDHDHHDDDHDDDHDDHDDHVHAEGGLVPHRHHGLTHYHDEEMQSVAVHVDGEVDPQKFFPWVQDLVAREGLNILRSKGILAFPGEPKRYVFQGVHMLLDGGVQREWTTGERRNSKIVFIGRQLDAKALRAGFEACGARPG
ncbi:MAG: CobW family GTP-binding protein, partial [Hyphomicrobiales bacterium]